jgi:MFS family permease
MNIEYFEPLSRAWNRMKTALFKPFDITKWFVIGFSAFLAGLTEWHPGSSRFSAEPDDLTFYEFFDLPNKAWDWLLDNPGWFIAIVSFVVVLIAIGVTFTWLSSRGMFMFLDNVAQDKAEIANPWKQYKTEGNSLFLWRLIFGLICFTLFIILLVFFFTTGALIYRESHYRHVNIPFLVGMGLFFFFMIVIIGYISMFLKSFVVPIMYKNHIKTTQAWSLFLPLFGQHAFHFILFGIFIFLLTIMFVLLIVVAGLLTCCIGIILLIIPYIGTVVSLPVWYTLRAFSLEYLAQFGPEYDVFPPAEAPAKSAAA